MMAIRHGLRTGFGIEEIFNLTKIGRWFLAQIKDRGNCKNLLVPRRLRIEYPGRTLSSTLVY